jgi:hypothetical protein
VPFNDFFPQAWSTNSFVGDTDPSVGATVLRLIVDLRLNERLDFQRVKSFSGSIENTGMGASIVAG